MFEQLKLQREHIQKMMQADNDLKLNSIKKLNEKKIVVKTSVDLRSERMARFTLV
jgi:hypothetical protein